jgi:hypothetical protein
MSAETRTPFDEKAADWIRKTELSTTIRPASVITVSSVRRYAGG